MSDFNHISDDNTVLKFKKLTSNAKTPIRTSRYAAGFDLFSAEEKEIEARDQGVVQTDISVQLPKFTYGRISPRSGLTVKFSIDIGAGVVDQDYTGNLAVVIFNHSDKLFKVNKGDRIAQLIIQTICTPKLLEVENLQETERASNRFGSTGK